MRKRIAGYGAPLILVLGVMAGSHRTPGIAIATSSILCFLGAWNLVIGTSRYFIDGSLIQLYGDSEPEFGQFVLFLLSNVALLAYAIALVLRKGASVYLLLACGAIEAVGFFLALGEDPYVGLVRNGLAFLLSALLFLILLIITWCALPRGTPQNGQRNDA